MSSLSPSDHPPIPTTHTSISSSDPGSSSAPSPPRKSRARTKRSRPAPRPSLTTPSDQSSSSLSTTTSPAPREDFATKAFQTDEAKQTLVNALEVYEWQKLFSGINTTFIYTDPKGRRRVTELTSDNLNELGIWAGTRSGDSGLRVVLAADEDEEKGGAKVEEITDEVEVDEMVVTPEEEVEETEENMALVRRGLEVPGAPRPRSIPRFEGPEPLVRDVEAEEEQKREKKRQKRTRSKMKKRGQAVKNAGPGEQGVEQGQRPLHDGETQQFLGNDAVDHTIVSAEESNKADPEDLSLEMARSDESTKVEWAPQEPHDALHLPDPVHPASPSPSPDVLAEEAESTDENKENVPPHTILPVLPSPLSVPVVALDDPSVPLPHQLPSIPTITITQEPIHPCAQPQYQEGPRMLTPVGEEMESSADIPTRVVHESKGPHSPETTSEVEHEIIVSLPTVSQPTRPLQPPLPSSVDLNSEGCSDIDHPHPHGMRPTLHVSPTHIDLLPLMIPSDDFDATFLAILPATPPAASIPAPTFGTPHRVEEGSLINDGDTESTKTSLTPRMTSLEVDVVSPPMMDLEEPPDETGDEDKAGDSKVREMQIDADAMPETPELGGPDLAVIWEERDESATVSAAEDDDDALLVFPSDPTPAQAPPLPASLPPRPTSIFTDSLPLDSSWTLFYSSPTTTSSTLISQSRLRPKGAAEYSHGLFHLFSYATLTDLYGAWKALRRRIANKHRRPIEEEGKRVPDGLEGLGVAFMPDDTNFHFFRTGIKPMWEDAMCAKGGKVMLTGTPARLDIAFHKLVILLAGGILDFEVPTPEGCMVVGAVLSKREKNSRVEIWLGGNDAPEAQWVKAVERFVYAEFPMEKGFPYRPFKTK